MKLNTLHIHRFKNLTNLSVFFDKRALTTVFVGQNGTGKSYLIEALVNIFRNLDLGEDPPFKYELEYACKGHKVNIDADPSRNTRRLRIRVDDETLARKHFGEQYLPNHVFGYYSGTSRRLEHYFDSHQQQFYRDLLAEEDDTEQSL